MIFVGDDTEMLYWKRIAIYGYGALGKIVESFLQEEGIRPIAIIDNYKYDDKTVSFDEFCRKNANDGVGVDAVIISISDDLVTENCIQELEKEKISYGIIVNGEEILLNKKMTYDDILWSDENATLLKLYRKLSITQRRMEEKLWENYWAHIYHDTINGSSWLIDKGISPGRWAVGYNFLYMLYRVLNDSMPRKILELGLGQSTKLTMQYAQKFNVSHLVVEHDEIWERWFLDTVKFQHDITKIMTLPLVEKEMLGEKYFEYKGFQEEMSSLRGVDVVLIDGPFGGGRFSRRDVLATIPEILNNDFIILLDDCGRMGEKNLVVDIQKKIKNSGITAYQGFYRGDGGKDVCVIVSENNKFFVSL